MMSERTGLTYVAEAAHGLDRRGRPSRVTAELLGTSEKMREVHDLIGRVADTDVTVLIRGESGTGKELVARAIHASSPRRHRTFVKVNCAALPSELLESELFGFERGAFTGAIQQKPGKFEFAHEGTMFLDEISEMHQPLQSKLLQVVQDGEFSRLGGRQEVHVDVRIVAATNRDLEVAVADGHFREDLFFRLNVVCITLPPLRQRREEIPLLTARFLQQYAEHYNKPPIALAGDTLRLFAEYEWPGNVRELENLVKRAVVLGSDDSIRRELADAIAGRMRHTGPIPALQSRETAGQASAAGLPPPPPIPAPPMPVPAMTAIPPVLQGSLKDIARHAAREAERELIYRTLQQTRWNRREAAEILGVSYKALLYKIKEAELDKAS
jgi:two-component system response regulator AtoC